MMFEIFICVVMLLMVLDEILAPSLIDHMTKHDACEVCRGLRGGVPGNENVLEDGMVVCDYCHVDLMPLWARAVHEAKSGLTEREWKRQYLGDWKIT